MILERRNGFAACNQRCCGTGSEWQPWMCFHESTNVNRCLSVNFLISSYLLKLCCLFLLAHEDLLFLGEVLRPMHLPWKETALFPESSLPRVFCVFFYDPVACGFRNYTSPVRLHSGLRVIKLMMESCNQGRVCSVLPLQTEMSN